MLAYPTCTAAFSCRQTDHSGTASSGAPTAAGKESQKAHQDQMGQLEALSSQTTGGNGSRRGGAEPCCC